jgi:hypothetical protein
MATQDPEHVVDCEVLCECAAKGCLEHISLTLYEYETVRARVSAHSFFLPGHEVREIDRIVEENDRYMVVRRSPTTPLSPAVRPGP